jgi:hypothetical protein
MIKPTDTSTRKNAPEALRMRRVMAAAKRMDRMVREENRRFGLPLIVMKDGKIQNIEA